MRTVTFQVIDTNGVRNIVANYAYETSNANAAKLERDIKESLPDYIKQVFERNGVNQKPA